MTDLFQPGQHPDADQLSAFAEDALPAHERAGVLLHLAECGQCRAVVSLASPEVEETQPSFVPTPVPWFARWKTALATAGLAAAALAVFAVYLHRPAPLREDKPTQLAAAPRPPSLPAKGAPAVERQPSPVGPARTITPPASDKAIAASALRSEPAIASQTIDTQAVQNLPLNGRSVPGFGSGVTAGSVNGAVAKTAPNPSAFAAAAPAPQPVIVAAAPPTPPLALAPSAPSSYVAETADRLAMDAATPVAIASARFRPLPSRLAIASALSRSGQTLALDSAGAVFLSVDSGQHWTAVRVPWAGRAVHLSLASLPQPVAPRVAMPAAPSAAGAVGGPVAQPASAALTGIVTDESGAVIGGAAIVLRDTATHVARSMKTDGSGRYTLGGLAPGTYQLEVSSQGFVEKRSVVTLAAAQSVSLNLSLPVGTASETVTVETESAQIATQSTVMKKQAVARSVARSVLAPVAFEVTTENGQRWTSSDGLTWSRK